MTLPRKNMGQPVRFEIANQTRQMVDDYISAADKSRRIRVHHAVPAKPKHIDLSICASRRQLASIGLDPCAFGTHSLHRIKPR